MFCCLLSELPSLKLKVEPSQANEDKHAYFVEEKNSQKKYRAEGQNINSLEIVYPAHPLQKRDGEMNMKR